MNCRARELNSHIAAPPGTHIMQELTAVRPLAFAAGIVAGTLAALAGQVLPAV